MISVVIPHYKDKKRLYTNLQHNLPFLKDCEIIIVNDFPEISLKKEVGQLFPTVILIENERNRGFAGAASVGINHSKNPYVFLLNDDVVLKNDSFKTALKYFDKDISLFAVSFRQVEKNGNFVGRNTIYWAGGFFRHKKGNSDKNGVNGWAEGGAMMFEKKKYEIIQGFDELYAPFYWEDIDLSYRAWKVGYTIYFDSQVLVEHYHESTIATHFKKSYINTIAYRNQLITIWKNISDLQYMREHIVCLAKNCILSLFKGNCEFIKGFWMALLLLPQIMKKRDQQKKLWKKDDKELFEQFNSL
ncbi:MAG: glycosyltransferase family 2 protein [bacterium]